MTHTIRTAALAIASILALGAARAQDAPNLHGTVKSISGNPIEGVEVRIDGVDRSTRTDFRGRFAFVKAPKGVQVLRFRLLGYLPARADVTVPTAANDTVVVTMLPTPQALDTVKVLAAVHVLAGIVVDNRDKPVPGAEVEMLGGANPTAITDSTGWFTFTSVQSGSVLLRARKLGFEPLNTSLKLEDWRGIVLHMEPLDYNLKGSKLETASGFGNTSTFVWNETEQRLIRRGIRSVIVPREELAPFDDLPLGEAIVRTSSGSTVAADLNSALSNVCVVIDGNRTVGPTSLNSFRADDVEFVELYPPGSENSGTVARYLRNAGCRRTSSASSFSNGVFYAVIWLRN